MTKTKNPRKIEKTRGGRLLKRTGVRQATIGEAIGVSQGAVAQYISGLAKPDTAVRRAILKAYGIAISSWDEVVSDSDGGANGDSTAVANDQLQSFEQTAERLTQLITRGIHRIETDDLGSEEEYRALNQLTATLERLGKITGEHANSKARILASKEFREVYDTIIAAAEPYPEAAAAMAAALRQLEAK